METMIEVTDIALKAAEAKRLRKQDKRISVRNRQTRDHWRPIPLFRLTKGKGGHGRNRINVHKKAR